MGIRRPAFCLALLAISFVSGANASPADPELKTGEVQLAFSADQVSTFPVDAQGLAEENCGGAKRGTAKRGTVANNLGRCRLTVSTDHVTALNLSLALQPLSLPSESSSQSWQWQATSLDLAGGTVETSCGAWNVSLSLDATDSQPASSLLLKPTSSDSGLGLLASVLEIKTRLHLANQATGQTVDYPLTFGLGLTGPWSLSSPDELAPDMSNVMVFDNSIECIPVWVVDHDPEQLKKLLNEGCKICLLRMRAQTTDPPIPFE